MTWSCWACLACGIGGIAAPIQDAGPPLTNAASVLSLPAAQAARAMNVAIRGVVTAAEASWRGKFIVQDSTGGVLIESTNRLQPEAGDLVEVSGITQPGAYAPTIGRPAWTRLGTAPLPAPKPVTVEQLMLGTEDGQRIEVSGIVRAVRITPAKLNLDVDLVSGGYRFHVFPKAQPGVDPQSLIGASVRVRGTATAYFNAPLRRLIRMVIFVPRQADFIVEKPAAANPFDEPVLPLDSIAQYRRDNTPNKRIHVKGTVTHQRPGEDVFIQDATGSLRVESRQFDTVAAGEVIEAVGFPDFERFLPVLQDAIFRRTADPPAPVAPKAVSVRDIQRGLHDSDFVVLKGKLLERMVNRGRLPGGGDAWPRTVLTLQNDDLVFTAEQEASEAGVDLAAIPIGSTIEIRGVCLTESRDNGRFKSLQVLLPSTASVRILDRPSRLTPHRLLIGLAILFSVLVLAVSWTVMLSKKNSKLKVLIRERAEAQQELQQAHDLLEERVKERTAQLKFEITARKESELQFKAVLAERTRLAQELHDTVEQTLTGIALQLDSTAKLFPNRPEGANHHLGLARSLVTQSQVDVRRSVWDLRCRALEQFDLPGALLTSSRQMTDGTEVHIEFKTNGTVRRLPEIVEENLLRIAQEAVTNVIKHAEATRTAIELDYGPRLVGLQVKDNGKGFAAGHCPGPHEGHFGLLGISERAKRLGGEAVISSEPGAGTTVRVQIPIAHEVPLAGHPEPRGTQ